MIPWISLKCSGLKSNHVDVNSSVSLAEWQSGHAAACKAVYLGSIPGSASSSLSRTTQSPC